MGTNRVSEYAWVPPWIDPDITTATLEMIQELGCADGDFWDILGSDVETMGHHSDEVIDYLVGTLCLGARPVWPQRMEEVAHYLRTAVGLWAAGIKIPADAEN